MTISTSFPPISFPVKPQPPFTKEPAGNPFPFKFPTMWNEITGRPYITVSSKGISNGLSQYINDGADFGPDTLQADGSLTQTSGIQEAITYSQGLNLGSGVKAHIYLKDGIYTINETINYPDFASGGFSMIANGDLGATLVAGDNLSGPLINFTPSSGAYNLYWQGIVFQGGPSGLTNYIYYSNPDNTGDLHFYNCYFGGNNTSPTNGALYLDIGPGTTVDFIDSNIVPSNYIGTVTNSLNLSQSETASVKFTNCRLSFYYNTTYGLKLETGSVFFANCESHAVDVPSGTSYTTPLIYVDGNTAETVSFINHTVLDTSTLAYVSSTGTIINLTLMGISAYNIDNQGITGVYTFENGAVIHTLNQKPTQRTILNGPTSGYVWYVIPDFQQGYKKYIFIFDSYENDTTTNQVVNFPLPFRNLTVLTENSTGLTISATTSGITITTPDSTTTYSGIVIVEGY